MLLQITPLADNIKVMTKEEKVKQFIYYDFSEFNTAVLNLLEVNPQGMNAKEIKKALSDDFGHIHVKNALFMLYMDKLVDFENEKRNPKYFINQKKKPIINERPTITVQG